MKVREWRMYVKADWSVEDVPATESNPQLHVMHEVEHVSYLKWLHLIRRTFTFTSELSTDGSSRDPRPTYPNLCSHMHRLIPAMVAAAMLVGLGVFVVFQI